MVMPGARSRTLDFIANVCDVCIITATCILSNLILHMMYSEVPTNFIFSERRQIAQIKQVKYIFPVISTWYAYDNITSDRRL